jgi:O-antigen ligase
LLWLLVFSVPWEEAFVAFGIGSMTRVFGIATVAIGLLTIIVSGKLRRPDVVLWLSFAFTLLCLLSLVWSISPIATASRVSTYVQLVALVWLVLELARTRDQQLSLMSAYCLGAYVSIADVMRRFVSGEPIDGRYTGNNLDPNDLGLTLAIGIPMAWYFFLNRTWFLRTLGAIYVPLAVLAILLTASRGAFLSAIVALSIVPITLPRKSFRSVILSVVLLGATGVAASVVPQTSWERFSTIGSEIAGGTMSQRTAIWQAGLQVFRDNAILGVGAGAFNEAVEPLLGTAVLAHNVYLAILAEQGVIGFGVFIALLASCGLLIYRMPPLERKVWRAIGLTWAIGVMSLSWEYRKTTWFLVGLVAAQARILGAGRQNFKAPTSSD